MDLAVRRSLEKWGPWGPIFGIEGCANSLHGRPRDRAGLTLHERVSHLERCVVVQALAAAFTTGCQTW